MNNAQLVAAFIEQIWNRRDFTQLGRFLHPDFTDHTLPPAFPANEEGLKQWINTTSASFDHETIIDDQVTEGDKSVIKIRILLHHTGTWRDIPATGLDVETVGYRLFRMRDGKIIEQWALVDGHTLENKLENASHGCKVAE